jgi:hypothetical protein
MATGADPIVGNWYEDLDNGQQFEVLEVNEDRRTIEIQYPNGDIDELDLSDWYDMDLEAVEGSEGVGAADAEESELEYPEADIEEKDWGARLARSRHNWDEGEDEEEEEEYDEWDEGYSERWDRDD